MDQPYLEVEHTNAEGPLHALHNLTHGDLAQLRDALRSRRLLQALRLQEADLPHQVRESIQLQADRLDIINATLNPSLHDHHHTQAGSVLDHGHPCPR